MEMENQDLISTAVPIRTTKRKFHNSSWSLFQVSIMAMEESRVLVWHRDKLKLSIMSDAFLQAVFDHILGRDVVHKLMQVLYKLYFLLSLPIFNIVLLYFRIKFSIALKYDFNLLFHFSILLVCELFSPKKWRNSAFYAFSNIDLIGWTKYSNEVLSCKMWAILHFYPRIKRKFYR